MVRQLLTHGVDLIVFDASAEALRSCEEMGAIAAPSLASLAASADIMILMLPHPDIVRESLVGPGGAMHSMRRGTLVVDMSTTGPSVVKECAAHLAERGIEIVDAPVGKGPAAAAKGELTILMGGDRKTCQSLEPLMKYLGSEVHYCGPLGSGQATKLVNNMVSCANAAILAEAFAVAHKAGADPEVLTRLMRGSAADSWQLRETVIGKALKNDFSPAFKLGLAHKDLQLALAMVDGLHATNSCLRGALSWYERGIAAGYGELDRAALMLLADPHLKKPE